MCECEHRSHFDTPGLHAYGVQRPTYPLATPYGTFRVCQECLGYGHMVLDIPPSPMVAPVSMPLPSPLTICPGCGWPLADGYVHGPIPLDCRGSDVVVPPGKG